MSKSITTVSNANTLPWQKLGMDEQIWNVLATSMYPGASCEAIMTVLAYHKQNKISPLTKCYHIVTYTTSFKNEDGLWEKRKTEQIIPGIALYRIQASRSGLYKGLSEPKFGPMITETFKGTDYNGKSNSLELTYPEWCSITVKVGLATDLSVTGEFTAIEYWKENYAREKKTGFPMAMWIERPSAQLAKVVESQALRKAFPELCTENTYEELQGKTFDNEEDNSGEAALDTLISDGVIATIAVADDTYQIDGKPTAGQDIFAILNRKVELIETADDSSVFDSWKNENSEQLRKWAHDNFNDPQYKEYLKLHKLAVGRVWAHKRKADEAALVSHIPDEFQAAYGVEQ